MSSAEKHGRTDAVVQPDSTAFAACEHLTRRPRHIPNRPVTRNSFVLNRVLRGLKMRFIGVQTNSISTREALSLPVLTLAITRLARETLQSEIRHRRQLGVHCIVICVHEREAAIMGRW